MRNLFHLIPLYHYYQYEALYNGRMLRRHLAASLLITKIPCIDLELILLNMIIEIRFFILITFCRYKSIGKRFVSEMILPFSLNI